MKCFLFTSHYWLDKLYVDKFISDIFFSYSNQKNFNVYERKVGQELLTYLETDDFKIARIFIDYFINYRYGNLPNDLQLVKLISIV